MFEEVSTPSPLLGMSIAQLTAKFGGTDKPIAAGEAPLLGRYITLGSERIADHWPKVADLSFEYEWSEDGPDAGKLMWIYVGSPHTGPLLSCDVRGGTAKWGNVYGSGDHDSEVVNSGTYIRDESRLSPCLADTIADRDYVVGGIEMHRARLIEGPALIEALQTAAALCSGDRCKNSPGQ